MGFGIQRDSGKVERVQDMKHLWPELLERPHIRAILGPDAKPESPHRAWPIPARVDDVVLSTARTLFVGDAAAATDAMTGEGIGQALLTGILAAEAIEAHGLDAAKVTDAYDRSVLAALEADHKMSLLLIRAIKHRKGARIAMRIAGADGLDPSQLRPLAVRGLPPRRRGDAPALAPRHVHRRRRLPAPNLTGRSSPRKQQPCARD